jgi:DNA-binding transcriptional ArsR family regulator
MQVTCLSCPPSVSLSFLPLDGILRQLEEATLKDVLSAERCAELLKALADAERLRLVQALRAGPQNVSELAALLENEIGNISHHLKVLRKHGLVTTQRRGKMVIYSLAESILNTRGAKADRLEFGCCCLELPK